ncbi:MAG TPA: SURF1 family protein [Gemmatimonadaceae bacterium]|nr:SURF1 family protein [Gemmatimonadaceae bacterium]
MPRRLFWFLLLAIVLAAACIRLGFWQLSRLGQRRSRNSLISARLSQPLVPLASLPAESSSVLRRAIVAGTPDFDHEITLAARSYQGSPGVYLLTPLRVPGNDTAILVNRGWIYAPDGVSVDLKGWREPGTSFVGYAELFPPGRSTTPDGVLRQDARIARELDLVTVNSLLPYPVSPLYLVATVADTTKPVRERVARLPAPTLDEGPHLSYAIQWFAFAAIALIGGATVAVRERRSDQPHGLEDARVASTSVGEPPSHRG